VYYILYIISIIGVINWPYICLVIGHASNVWLDLDLLHSRVYI